LGVIGLRDGRKPGNGRVEIASGSVALQIGFTEGHHGIEVAGLGLQGEEGRQAQLRHSREPQECRKPENCQSPSHEPSKAGEAGDIVVPLRGFEGVSWDSSPRRPQVLAANKALG